MSSVPEPGGRDAGRALKGRALTAWLESPEGEAWSRARHLAIDRYSRGVFADVKDDHPSGCPYDGSDIDVANRWGLEILAEIAWYGMSRLPEAA
jgi:hypothetical protein